MIEVKDLHKALGEFSLHGVDLRVESGEYFVVLGPTGSGKTVLLECIAGLHRQDRGEIWLEGREVSALAPEQRNIGYVPQDYVLFPHISLQANIAFALNVRRRPPDEIEARVRELAELLHISHLLDRRPRTLSGGEQQRGALARALAPRPTLMLLDEPLSALDEGTRAELAGELRGLSGRLGTTIIHVCHNFDEALQLADRIAIIHGGRVLQVGTPGDVFRRPRSAFVARFVGAENIFPVIQRDHRANVVTVGQSLPLQVTALPDHPSLLTMIRPEEIMLRPADAPMPPFNSFHANLLEVEDRGRLMRLNLAGPLPLLVVMTPQAFRESGVAPGDQVQVHCPPEAVHLLPQDSP
ncbi:MAG: ABC transporter ATP-binding protein [Armatimonadetes bacterium]|nr:ABC transporter ATP-binding protein [Armatimonadota bacterium]